MTAGGAVWSQASDLAGKCFNGTLCPAPAAGAVGLTRAPDLARDACPVGRYCPAGSSVATVCPAGTVQPVTGQDALNDSAAAARTSEVTTAAITMAAATSLLLQLYSCCYDIDATSVLKLLLPLLLPLQLLVAVESKVPSL
eukprot:21268-Heterococcus_DN1.PRE.3